MRSRLIASTAVTVAALAPVSVASASRHPHARNFPRGQCTRYAYVKRPDIVDVTIARTGIHDWTASRWADNAAAGGFRVDAIPHAGDIAAWGAGSDGAGPSGHLAFVQYVSRRGTIRVSEVNFNGNPRKTVRRIRAGRYSGARFIHHLR